MQQIKNLTLYHLRKESRQYISFAMILCFTAFIINIALVLVRQVEKSYDDTFDKLNTANINFCIPKNPDSDVFGTKIQNVKDVDVVESKDGILLSVTAKDFRETEFNMNTIFYNIKQNSELNQYEMIESKDEIYNNAIIIPRYIAEFGEYKLGENITYLINGKEYTFRIAGIIQEMQFGNYGSGLMGVYLGEECYQNMLLEFNDHQVSMYGLKVEKGADSTNVSREINRILDEEKVSLYYNNTDVKNKQVRTMVSNLVVVILVVFAVIVLAVCLFLSRFRIQNMIQEDMTNLGVLKAMGYTGKNIILTVVLPYLISGGIAVIMGILLSYTVLGSLVQVLTIQSGFAFDISFDLLAGFITIIILLTIVFFTTWFSAGKIRKLQPLLAIRGEDSGRFGVKNHFPMDKTSGNVQILLILKRVCGQVKQNVLLFVVSFLMMGLIAFAGTLFYNVVIKPDNFLKTLSEETPDIMIQIKAEEKEEFVNELIKNQKINKVLSYGTKTIKLNNDSTIAFVCEDFSKVRNDLCYEGKNPDNNNEIAMGSAFKEEYQLGDQIEISTDYGVASYEIVGFVQSVNNSGNVCELTEEGYLRLNKEETFQSLNLYVKDGVNVEELMEELETTYQTRIVQIVNYVKMMKTSTDMYSGIVKIVVIAVIILTTLIIFLILYVIIKSMMIRNRQELGIYKAMGYSSKQLIIQMAGSFLPVIGGSAILSAMLGCVYMPYLNNMIFSMVGAMKNYCEVSLGIMILFALIQTIISFCLCVSLALPVKKISAYSLIRDL